MFFLTASAMQRYFDLREASPSFDISLSLRRLSEKGILPIAFCKGDSTIHFLPTFWGAPFPKPMLQAIMDDRVFGHALYMEYRILAIDIAHFSCIETIHNILLLYQSKEFDSTWNQCPYIKEEI